MNPVSRDEILKRMESIQPGEKLKLRTTPTFGEMTIIVELNPDWPKKGEKKYRMWVGKTEAAARKDKPFYQSDKPKKLAGWAAERWPQWLTEDAVTEKAA